MIGRKIWKKARAAASVLLKIQSFSRTVEGIALTHLMVHHPVDTSEGITLSDNVKEINHGQLVRPTGFLLNALMNQKSL